MNEARPSPFVAVYDALGAANPSWRVTLGRPAEPGWLAGEDLRDATRGPFHELLLRIGERQQSSDRKTIAASFALRYAWSSAMAIAPFLKFACVPDVSLANVSLRFSQAAFFERTALHDARGTVLDSDPAAGHPSVTTVPDRTALLQTLRGQLREQAAPVVDALYAWSGFSRRGSWGMITSSWAAHFTGLGVEACDQRPILPTLTAFFEGEDIVSLMRPRLHTVTHVGATHVYQRRSSCCRYYLLPQGHLCASCPLVAQERRIEMNRDWMEKQVERERARQTLGGRERQKHG